MDVVRRVGYLMDIEDDGFIALMDRYCDAIPPILSQTEAQVLMGIETTSAVRAKGIDLHQSISVNVPPDISTSVPNKIPRGGRDKFQFPCQEHCRGRQTYRLKTGSVSGAGHEPSYRMVLELDGSFPGHVGGRHRYRRAADCVQHQLAQGDRPKRKSHLIFRDIGAEIEVFALLRDTSLEELAVGAVAKSRYRLTPTEQGRQHILCMHLCSIDRHIYS